ncbi:MULTISPECIES: alpha/beta hydrolase family protein [Hyphobacterium]|uniref:Alpha/beta hydrolase family protein n=1 Tax=Hyphobacterium vulgare TaxID=1736751 RepID=A0ABV6ZVB7_9PROT
MRTLVLILVLLTPGLAAADQASVWGAPGAHTVSVSDDSWTDTDRDRDIPVRIYRPDGDGPFPVVIFSHGLGGSREAAPYLGEHWASWGFLAVFVQHPGSDESVWQGQSGPAAMQALRQAANARSAVARYRDIPFVLDEIERRTATDELPADTARMGIAGHSFGAHTVMAALGRDFGPGGRIDFDDPRLLAGVALSPPPADDRTDGGAVYAGIAEPVLHLSGTEDGSPLDAATRPEDRLEAFAAMGPAPQYLIVFEGGDHSVFGGRSRPGRPDPENYPVIQSATAEASTAFFRAWLAGDDVARSFIDGAPFAARFDRLGRVETRNVE